MGITSVSAVNFNDCVVNDSVVCVSDVNDSVVITSLLLNTKDVLYQITLKYCLY